MQEYIYAPFEKVGGQQFPLLILPFREKTRVNPLEIDLRGFVYLSKVIDSWDQAGLILRVNPEGEHETNMGREKWGERT